MKRRLLAVIFLVFCHAAFVSPVGYAAGADGLFLSGSAELPVRIEVFSDFQCPACGYFFLNTVQQILKNYKDRVSLVYYEFPLEQHRYSRRASHYVTAVAGLGDQQKLSAVFEALFADRDKWAEDGNLDASVSRVMSPEDFEKVKSIMETDRARIEQEIEASIREGIKREISGTPAMFFYHAGTLEKVVLPRNVRDWYTLLSWRLNGLLRR